MENLTYNNMLTGYKDRVTRIALFDIFASLDKKQLKDENNKPLDFFGLGLLSLLFFFESRLMRIKKRGTYELAAFLEDVTEGKLYTEREGYNLLAKTIIEVFRPSGGKRNKRLFMNYETGERDVIEYAILKADDWDTKRKIQYYTLDEQGLELIFATKEYFSEFQISISQMMLRKQLEKGEFLGALRQVDEMRISVNTIKDNIYRIKHDIQRNITSEDTYSRYKELISDINGRLRQEEDEFIELSKFIKETKGYLDSSIQAMEKDQKALGLLVRIDNELAHVHYLHSTLLSESIELKTTALEAASESLYYAGITSFNFDQELARAMTSVPIPFMESRRLVKPFLKLEYFETWSPLAVFSSQQQDNNNNDNQDSTFIDIDEAIREENHIHRQITFKLVMGLIKPYLDSNGSVSITELYEQGDNRIWMDSREFCEAMVVLHQMSPLIIDEVLEANEHIFYQAVTSYFKDVTTIEVIEISDEIIQMEHYDIKNIKLIINEVPYE